MPHASWRRLSPASAWYRARATSGAGTASRSPPMRRPARRAVWPARTASLRSRPSSRPCGAMWRPSRRRGRGAPARGGGGGGGGGGRGGRRGGGGAREKGAGAGGGGSRNAARLSALREAAARLTANRDEATAGRDEAQRTLKALPPAANIE